jgi:hypothetical protein
MSSKPETTYYLAVNKLLPKSLHKEKIHNPYRGGTADFWYSGNLDDLWVEYKYIAKLPKRDDSPCKLDLSQLQLQWLRGRHDEGRNVVVILGTPLGSWVYTGLEWETKLVTRPDIIQTGLTKQNVANYIRRRTMIT